MTITIQQLDAHGHTMLRLLRWVVPGFEEIEGGARVETDDSRDLLQRLHRVDPNWRNHLELDLGGHGPPPEHRHFAGVAGPG